MSVIRNTLPSPRSSFQPRVGLRPQQWWATMMVVAVAIFALLSSVHASFADEDVQQPVPANDALTPTVRDLGTPSTANFQTITITTPASDPYTFTGMPATLKAGTYTFKYINNSDEEHNFKIRGAGGFRDTPICAKCTNSITVTLTRYVNGVLAPNRQYLCEPHKTFMKGTVQIIKAT